MKRKESWASRLYLLPAKKQEEIWESVGLGTMADTTLAKQLGVSNLLIGRERRKRKIPIFGPKHGRRKAQPKTVMRRRCRPKNKEHDFLQHIDNGVLKIDKEGRIWRIGKYTKYKTSTCVTQIEPRRAEFKSISGTLAVTIKGVTVYAHRLVWQYFNGDIPKGFVVRRKEDASNNNNRPNNLIIAPKKALKKTDLETNGEGITEIHQLRAEGLHVKEIASLLNTSIKYISKILNEHTKSLPKRRTMTPPESDTSDRIDKPTPNKRGAQVGMIKAIQHTLKKDKVEGHWLHTAGPGKVAINYYIFEQAFHSNCTYTIIEYSSQAHKKMTSELSSLQHKLKRHLWSNKIKLKRAEIFSQAILQIENKGHKVTVVDADLCTTPSSMIKQGILRGIQLLCTAQKKRQQDFFIALTFATRNLQKEDKTAIRLINNLIAKNKGKEIYNYGYRDGAPMRTITWYIKQGE